MTHSSIKTASKAIRLLYMLEQFDLQDVFNGSVAVFDTDGSEWSVRKTDQGDGVIIQSANERLILSYETFFALKITASLLQKENYFNSV